MSSETFTARNGVTVHVESSGEHDRFTLDGRQLTINDSEHAALAEYFQRYRDRELGRWRSVNDPAWTAWVNSDGRVNLMHEPDGRMYTMIGRSTKQFVREELRNLAAEYWDAHPEPKPWQTEPRPGETWILTYAGRENVHAFACDDHDFMIAKPCGAYVGYIEADDPAITAGRKAVVS